MDLKKILRIKSGVFTYFFKDQNVDLLYIF